jgi:hypothetical protein
MASPRTIKIEKVQRPLKGWRKYPVKEMNIATGSPDDDSLWLEGVQVKDLGWFRGYYKQEYGYRFQMENRMEGGKSGVRIWRVA